MQEALESKPEMVSAMLVSQASLTRTYLFEAFFSTDMMVQG